jgi:hypothetical protein
LASDDVATPPLIDARAAFLRTARAAASDAPRIVQYINAETAERLLILCGGKERPALAVLALDDQGRTWSMEPISDTCPVEAERGRLIWRRLWVPPLPHGEGE